MIDVDAIRRKADLAQIVGADVELRRVGAEHEGLCPFHTERTASFRVVPDKGFVHCFGCGAHYDVIGYVMQMRGLDFLQACRAITGENLSLPDRRAVQREVARQPEHGVWVQVLPVPDDAPRFAPGESARIWNIKRGRWWPLTPERADAYRDAQGRLLGYVLRVQFGDGSKVTPAVTWCIGPDGTMRWCCKPWPAPRPLQGLDALAARPDAPVLVTEGEKCRAAGAGALPMYAAVTWPGGSKGLRHVDWAPLYGRAVVLWPDADEPGRQAMLGYQHRDGRLVPGVAQYAMRNGAASVRFVDTGGQPKGWDIADALADGWTPRQLAAWAASRVVDVEVRVDADRLQVA